MSKIEAAVEAATKEAVLQGIYNASTPLSSPEAQAAANMVAKTVADAIHPVVEKLCNQEPWYHSKVILGSLVTIIASLVGMVALLISEPAHGILYLLFGVALAGAMLTLSGRLFSPRPEI
jgi:hypothetical protein